ncbi:MAG: hypothetical protein IKZ58_04805 [Selenomonadaceae bacterium]|nr:hypothetical protein [Selenomonadaceae bacterium]
MNVVIELPMEEMRTFFYEITENPEWLYLFAPYSIGDFLIAGGLSYAVQAKKNKSATVLIAQDRMKNLDVSYENVIGTIYVPVDLIKAANAFIHETEIYERDNFIYGNFHAGDNHAYDDTLTAVDRFKKYVFDLPIDTPIVYPTIKALDYESISNLRGKYILNKKRTIILLPQAKTFKNLDENFWIKMAKILDEKNYIVYTNVADDEKPVEGTWPITTNFSELYYITDKVKCFIGMRSGIFDFLAMTDAKIFNIIDFPRWDWDIKFNYPNCDAQTFYDAVQYREPLENKLKSQGLPPKIELNHEHIAMKDIYFSYEDILGAIINAIEKI